MPAPAGRIRLDRLLVARGLFESRARAQAAILAGLVQVDGQVGAKPAAECAGDARLDATPVHDFVSRGALKLDAALEAFAIDPAGLAALDVGASTGGFTELLLRRGAVRVHAVDVGHDQFHPRLRGRPDIDLREGTDIRRLQADALDPVDLVVIDVSFIPLAQVLPAALGFAAPGARLVALVKPQFEAGPGQVRKGQVKKGIVRDPAVHAAACEAARESVEGLGWRVLGVIASPIEGGDGNREFLIGAVRP